MTTDCLTVCSFSVPCIARSSVASRARQFNHHGGRAKRWYACLPCRARVAPTALEKIINGGQRNAPSRWVAQLANCSGPVSALAEKLGIAPTRRDPPVACRRMLKGHFGKVYAVHWAPDSQHVARYTEHGAHGGR